MTFFLLWYALGWAAVGCTAIAKGRIRPVDIFACFMMPPFMMIAEATESLCRRYGDLALITLWSKEK